MRQINLIIHTLDGGYIVAGDPAGAHHRRSARHGAGIANVELARKVWAIPPPRRWRAEMGFGAGMGLTNIDAARMS